MSKSELEIHSSSHVQLYGAYIGDDSPGCQDYSKQIQLHGVRIVDEKWLLKVVEQRDLAAAQVEWLQKVNTLHRQVDILYVVDGYEVTISWDDNPISEGFHGETVAEAISKAMAGFDFEAQPKWLDKDIYGHERQMAALVAQRDELLAALERTVEYHVPEVNPLSDAADLSARAAIAKAKGGAA